MCTLFPIVHSCIRAATRSTRPPDLLACLCGPAGGCVVCGVVGAWATADSKRVCAKFRPQAAGTRCCNCARDSADGYWNAKTYSLHACRQCKDRAAEAEWARTARASGLKWRKAGDIRPTTGRSLEHPELANALASKTRNGDKTEFTQEEWDAFGITDLRIDHFVKTGMVNAPYFQPAQVQAAGSGSAARRTSCMGFLGTTRLQMQTPALTKYFELLATFQRHALDSVMCVCVYVCVCLCVCVCVCVPCDVPEARAR